MGTSVTIVLCHDDSHACTILIITNFCAELGSCFSQYRPVNRYWYFVCDNTGHSACINTHDVLKNCRLLRSVLCNTQLQSSGTKDSFLPFNKTAQSCGKRHLGVRTSVRVLDIFGPEIIWRYEENKYHPLPLPVCA